MGNCLRSCSSVIGTTTSTTKAPTELNVLLLGLDGAGKTEVVNVLARTERIDFSPTVGCKSDPIELDGVRVRLTELGGAKNVRGIWKHYYREAHGVIFLVDSADHQRILLARQLLANIVLHSKLSGKPMLIVCSKQDQPDAIDYLDCCTYLDIERLANLARTPCFVATTGRTDYVDLEAGTRWLLGTIAQHMRRILNQNEYFADETLSPTGRRVSRLHSSRSLRGGRAVTARKQHGRDAEDDQHQPNSEVFVRLRRPHSAPSSAQASRLRNGRHRIRPLNVDEAIDADVMPPQA